jgi:hypothetical protein
MAQQILSTNTFTTAKWIVSATASNGTHTTIAAALTSASSGDTIFIRPGTYTENITLKAGVNLTAYQCDSGYTGGVANVIINGTCSFSSAGTVSISGVMLQTNGSTAFLALSGSAASIVNLMGCNLNCTSNTGITNSVANTSSIVTITNCTGDLGTTGIAYFSDSSTGIMVIEDSTLVNSGLSTTASTKSAGSIAIVRSKLFATVTHSSSSVNSLYDHSRLDCAAINTTALTTSGTGRVTVQECIFASGSASSISIGSGTTVVLSNTSIDSTNTNAVTGAGTLQYTEFCTISSGKLFNTTTLTKQACHANLYGITTGVAPAAGFVGESIRGYNGSPISLTTNTPVNITSISLTPGIWDVSGIVQYSSNTTTNTTAYQISISAVSATQATIGGDDNVNIQWGNGVVRHGPALTIPSLRVTLSATTTYYLVAQATFTLSTLTAFGRISATRVA